MNSTTVSGRNSTDMPSTPTWYCALIDGIHSGAFDELESGHAGIEAEQYGQRQQQVDDGRRQCQPARMRGLWPQPDQCATHRQGDDHQAQ